MSESKNEPNPLLMAIINLVAKVGIDAAIALLESKMATIDDAISSLRRAKEKSLAEYIDEAPSIDPPSDTTGSNPV